MHPATRSAFFRSAIALAAAALAACAGDARREELRDIGVPDFSPRTRSGVETSVNKYLWTAAFETLDFLPVAYADPYAGLIVTEWRSDEEAPGERVKTNVYILDQRLRTDALKVSVFRQVRGPDGGWVDAPVAPGTAREIENAILTRARELRLNTVG